MLHQLIHSDDLWIGEKKAVEINGLPLVIVHTVEGYSVFLDKCPHAGAKLSEGDIKGSMLICYRHHWQFNSYTGKGINPCNTHLQRFPLLMDEEGLLWIELGD